MQWTQIKGTPSGGRLCVLRVCIIPLTRPSGSVVCVGGWGGDRLVSGKRVEQVQVNLVGLLGGLPRCCPGMASPHGFFR